MGEAWHKLVPKNVSRARLHGCPRIDRLLQSSEKLRTRFESR